MSTSDLLPLIFQNVIWSGLATLGFAVLFNVPRHVLAYCVVAGMCGFVTRSLLAALFGATLGISTFIGAIVIGFLAFYFARLNRIPTSVFAVSAAIPMVPGKLAFESLVAALNIVNQPEVDPVLVSEVMVTNIQIFLVLSAIAVGISFPILLFQRVKPVV